MCSNRFSVALNVSSQRIFNPSSLIIINLKNNLLIIIELNILCNPTSLITNYVKSKILHNRRWRKISNDKTLDIRLIDTAYKISASLNLLPYKQQKDNACFNVRNMHYSAHSVYKSTFLSGVFDSIRLTILLTGGRFTFFDLGFSLTGLLLFHSLILHRFLLKFLGDFSF